jgi:hypothetical protein
LTDPADVVVGTADETYQVLDRILAQDSNSWEKIRLGFEIGIQLGPFDIQIRQRHI